MVARSVAQGRPGHQRGARPYGEGSQYTRVGERCEIDCWNIPLFLLLEKAGVTGEIPDEVSDELRKKGKRIHVAGVVEKATGYILSMKFGLGETAELTTAALKMALTDKTDISNWAGCEQRWNLFTGIEECTTDAGPGFIGDRFLSAVIPAATSHVYAASGLPHLRGLVGRSSRPFTRASSPSSWLAPSRTSSSRASTRPSTAPCISSRSSSG